MKKDKIEIGLLGINQSHQSDINLLKKHKNFEVKGFFNVYDTAVNDISYTDIKQFESIDLLFHEVDAIMIFSSVNKYYESAITAIKKSKHLFLGNLVDVRIEKTENLFKLAREANVKIQIRQTPRFSNLFQHTLDKIKKPQYIEIHHYDYFPEENNELYSKLLYDVSIIKKLSKGKIQKVAHSRGNPVNDISKFLNIRLETDNGCFINVLFNFLENIKKEEIQIIESDQSFRLNMCNHKFQFFNGTKNKTILIEKTINSSEPFERELSFFFSNCKLFHTPDYAEKSNDAIIIEETYRIWDAIHTSYNNNF